MSGHRGLAHNRDFAALWVGQTISELGSRVSMFVFPLLTYTLTGSAMLSALSEALHLLGLAAMLLPAGVLADRVDPRRLMRLSSGSGVLLYGSLAVAGVVGTLSVAHLLVVALLTGAGVGLFGPAEMSAVRAVVPTDDLPTALSQNQARLHVAGLLGAPLGGVLYAVARWLPFAADAVTFAISWVLLGRIRRNLAVSRPDHTLRRRRRDVVEGIRFIASRPFFRVHIVWAALTNLTINALFLVAVLRLIEAGVDPLHIGLVETSAGLAGIVGSVVAPWIIDRLATGWLTVTTAWSFLPLVIPMVLWDTPAVVAAALSLGMLFNPAGNAGIGSYRIAVTPTELVGRVQSTAQFVSMSALPLAPVVGGALLSGLGGARAIAVLGALTAGVALIPTCSHAIRSVPRPDEWPRYEGPGTATVPAANASSTLTAHAK